MDCLNTQIIANLIHNNFAVDEEVVRKMVAMLFIWGLQIQFKWLFYSEFHCSLLNFVNKIATKIVWDENVSMFITCCSKDIHSFDPPQKVINKFFFPCYSNPIKFPLIWNRIIGNGKNEPKSISFGTAQKRKTFKTDCFWLFSVNLFN